VGHAVAPHGLDQRARRLRRARTDDLDAETVQLLEQVAPPHERGRDRLAELLVVEEQPPELVALDGDVAHRLGDDRRDVDRLAREEVQLAEEPARSVADDLVALAVADRHLALFDGDERVRAVADGVQDVADLGRALLAVAPQRLEVRSVSQPSPLLAIRPSPPTDRRALEVVTPRSSRGRA
jgi:hypothetical protein